MLSIVGRRVTLSQIAAAAGVTKSSASVALNGRPGVSSETRQHVHAVAQRLGYRPDAGLRALADLRWSSGRTRRSVNLAFLLPGGTARNEFHRRIVDASRECAESLGYGVELIDPDDYRDSAQLTRTLQARGVRGLLLLRGDPKKPWRSEPEWDRFCVIQLESQEFPPRFHQVRIDFYGEMLRLCQQAVEDGHRRIGIIQIETDLVQVDEQRLAAWYMFRKSHPRATSSIPAAQLHPRWPEELEAWLNRYTPTAVIDFTAQFLLPIRRTGRKVPDQLAYYSLHVMRRGGISGMMVPCEELGAEGVAQLDLLVRGNRLGKTQVPKVTLISSRFYRGSTAPAAFGLSRTDAEAP